VLTTSVSACCSLRVLSIVRPLTRSLPSLRLLMHWVCPLHLANSLPESSGTNTRDFMCFFLFWLISLPAIWFPIHKMYVLLAYTPFGGRPSSIRHFLGCVFPLEPSTPTACFTSLRFVFYVLCFVSNVLPFLPSFLFVPVPSVSRLVESGY
jgi:hypothetical protein